MVDIAELQLDAGQVVNGRWEDLPGFPGVRLRIAHFRLQEWLRWLKEKREEFSSDEECERAFYGARIVIDLEGLEDGGKPIKWTEEVGQRYFTQSAETVNNRTGEAEQVYLFDAPYFWAKQYAQDPGNYAAAVAGN